MKVIKRLIYLWGVVTFCASLSTYANDSITFASGAPLNDYQARIIIPILTEAFRKNNISFSAKYIPSLRSLQISNSGKLDGELHRVSNFHEITENQYSNLLRIDYKFLSVHLTLFAKEKFVINNSGNLQHFNLAYYRGRNDVDKLLSQHETQKNIYKVNTDLQAFQMLAANRVDIVISESHIGNSIINSDTKFGNIKEIKRLAKTDIYSYIHKKHQLLLPALKNTLQQMQLQGELEQMESKVQKYQRK